MPEITKVFNLQVTPERFLDACSPTELYELQQLLYSTRYQNIIADVASGNEAITQLKNDLNARSRQNQIRHKNGNTNETGNAK